MAASGNILDALAPDILNCIAEHTAREDLPNLHLVSKDFCGAVRQLSIDLHPSRQIQDSHLAYLASHFPRATDLDLRECQSLTHHAFTILGRFSNLRRLSLHNCKWVFSTAAAEQLSQLTRLEALDLSKCNTLGPLPDGITKLARLKDLKLKECASLVELPAGIGALSELQTLDLGGCTNLSALPESFTELTGLQELSLIRTKLQGLPEGISALSMLSVLNLAGCTSLEILPEGIGGLSRVRTLNLMACKDVQVLPESIRGMVSLKDLSLLKCTGLWALPDALTSLQDLQRVDIRLCSQEVHDSLESLQALPGAVDGHFSKVIFETNNDGGIPINELMALFEHMGMLSSQGGVFARVSLWRQFVEL